MGLRTLALTVALAVAGCGTLPASGPTSGDIVGAENPEAPLPDYVVVDIDERVANIAGQYREPGFSSLFKVSDRMPQIQIAPGDQLQVNIFEAGADGLFSTAGSKVTNITAVVDQWGRIFVPYVGPIEAAGQSPEDLRVAIEAALEDKAIQPEVQVLVGESVANAATVIGDVATPGRYPVAVGGMRVLDLVAVAGGSDGQSFQTRLVLRRGNTVATADLEDIFDNPDDNVPIRPGDNLLVTTVARTFTLFGALNDRREVEFTTRRVTLAEGLARGGGLDDQLADAAGIFLFRFEPDHIAKAVSERAITAPEASMVPVVYRLNLKDPKAFFLSSTFELRDEDIIFVANSPSTQFSKFLELLAPIVSTTTTVVTLTTRVGGSR
jgi:polysaccharide export outer membrane protein